jgi:hypothetical protein
MISLTLSLEPMFRYSNMINIYTTRELVSYKLES